MYTRCQGPLSTIVPFSFYSHSLWKVACHKRLEETAHTHCQVNQYQLKMRCAKGPRGSTAIEEVEDPSYNDPNTFDEGLKALFKLVLIVFI